MGMLIDPYIYSSGDVYILDELSSSPLTAYSMRLLTKNYLGNCIRIRRDSDGVETDIAFGSDGIVSSLAISTHLGVGSGTIVTWYDQSGNGHDITNSDAAQQPVITTGQFSGHSSLYVANFNLVENLHSASIGGIDQNTLDMYAVSYKDSTAWACLYTATLALGNFGSSYTAMLHTSTQSRGYIGGVNNGATVTLNGEAIWNRIHRTGAGNDNENEVYIESTGSTTTSSAANAATESDVSFIMMGMERESPTSSGYSGDILEVIHFDGVVLSSGDKTTLENDQKSYYNL